MINVKMTVEEVRRAMDALDNNEISEEDFDTDRFGIFYNYRSPKGNLYGPKRIAECVMLLRGEVHAYYEFTCNWRLRAQIEAAGFFPVQIKERKFLKCQMKKTKRNAHFAEQKLMKTQRNAQIVRNG